MPVFVGAAINISQSHGLLGQSVAFTGQGRNTCHKALLRGHLACGSGFALAMRQSLNLPMLCWYHKQPDDKMYNRRGS